jgi:hypothetical protein
MRRNCPHCGADQAVADEKLTAGWIFLKCHQCAMLSALQGKAALNLIRAADKPLRTKFKTNELSEPLVFGSHQESSQPTPVLLEVEEPQRESLTFERVRDMIRSYAVPLVLALVCFASGAYLIRSARLIREGDWGFLSQNSAPVASDVVAQSASGEMERAPASSDPQPPVAQAAPPPVQHPAPAAPASEEKVQVLAASAVLRAGPGMHYNKVGTARAELQFLVKGSFDNWIEVRTGTGSKTAWIRSDLVKPLKQVAKQEAQP